MPVYIRVVLGKIRAFLGKIRAGQVRLFFKAAVNPGYSRGFLSGSCLVSNTVSK
jgi:hypothetical protein